MTTDQERTQVPGVPLRSPVGVALVAATVLASSVGFLDAYMINVAIPAIGRSLRASITQLQWVVTGYTLALGVVVPASAWLGDRFGLSRMYTVAMLAFAAGSALCGLAWDLNSLVVFRIVQAIPGGLLPVMALSILYRIVPREKIGAAMGLYGLGVVVAPAIGETVLKAVDFVPIAGRKILCVVVSATGFIDNKVIETEEEIPREELMRISNYLTESFAGRTLLEIRERLVRMMVEEKAQMDRVLARTLELAQVGLAGGGGPGVVVDGTSMLLAKPELADLARVRRMFDAFADKARLVRILNRCLQEGGGVRVLIGEDCDLTSELEFSVVAAPYGLGERPLGTLGIVGPSRMDYETVIPLVHFLGETLSRALADAFTGEPDRRPERK